MRKSIDGLAPVVQQQFHLDPFQPKVTNRYNNKAYQLAMNDTTYNSEGRAVISKDDEWAKENEWDDIFEQMKKERGI